LGCSLTLRPKERSRATRARSRSVAVFFRLRVPFAEFERSMIRQRVRAGLNTIKAAITRDGKFTSKAGVVRRRLGRPGAETTRLTDLGTGPVHHLKHEMAGAPLSTAFCRVTNGMAPTGACLYDPR